MAVGSRAARKKAVGTRVAEKTAVAGKATEKKDVGGFKLVGDKEAAEVLDRYTHVYRGGRCETETRGYPEPDNLPTLELVVNAPNGLVTLWDRNVTLNWRFQKQSLELFQNPDAVKQYVRGLIGKAILKWDNAVPVRFTERAQPWDFEISIRTQKNCSVLGCTLARAFFPDSGQHELILFPDLFDQSEEEQIETIVHELGHVFGLRHFFAQTNEIHAPSVLFGTHKEESIMNYGDHSRLTDIDKSDLARLYQAAWSGTLTEINGTPIRLVRPYSHFQQDMSAAPQAAVVAPTAWGTGPFVLQPLPPGSAPQ